MRSVWLFFHHRLSARWSALELEKIQPDLQVFITLQAAPGYRTTVMSCCVPAG